MSLPVVLSYEAKIDFDPAADWYQDQAGLGWAGLGARFTDAVRKALDGAGQMPELHAVLQRGIRRAKVQKFPYCVDHRVQADRVVVIAVLHNRRDPSVWKSRA